MDIVDGIQCREINGTPKERRGAFREASIEKIYRVVEVGVESVRELVDEVFCAAETGGFADLVVIMCEGGIAKPDVLTHLHCALEILLPGCMRTAHGEGELCVVLEEDGHSSTQVSKSESFDVTAVDEDCALRWVVDAGDQFQDRALSRSVHPNNDLLS
jgi:hypothetical protein